MSCSKLTAFGTFNLRMRFQTNSNTILDILTLAKAILSAPSMYFCLLE